MESFEIWTVVPASPEAVYAAWLDAIAHSAFTGQPATVEPSVGSRFTAFGEYIEGTNRELEPGRRILQSWRTTEFSADDPDSLLEVVLEPHEEGTRLTLRHSEIPEGQGDRYEGGWQEHYFEPLKRFFQPKKAATKKTAPRRSSTKKAVRKKAAVKKAASRKAAAKRASPRKAAGKSAARRKSLPRKRG
jgi:uncharacterized protein YndB with AHSA1/START domain